MNRIIATKHVIRMIGSAVPILTIANRATSGWRLHHHQQQQHSRKMVNEEQDEATSLYISFMMSMVMAQTRCTMAHSPSRCLFLSDGGNNNSDIVSFDFRVTIPGKKILRMRRTLNPIHCRLYARSVYIWIELSRGLNSIASNPIRFFCQIKVSILTE